MGAIVPVARIVSFVIIAELVFTRNLYKESARIETRGLLEDAHPNFQSTEESTILLHWCETERGATGE